MNILAIGAHPDDIEFFCAGTLARYKKQGHKIFFALVTSGNQGSHLQEDRALIGERREKEQLEAAKLWDAEVRFMQFDDQCVQDTPETRRAILNAIRWADPDVIFTHYPFDPSTDHAMVGKITGEVLLAIGGNNMPADLPPCTKKPSLFFWDTAAGIGFHPEAYVDITEEISFKKDGLALHKSQYAWMDTFQLHGFVDHSVITATFRGLQSGFAYAEGFVGFRLHGFMPDFRLLP